MRIENYWTIHSLYIFDTDRIACFEFLVKKKISHLSSMKSLNDFDKKKPTENYT